MPDDRDDPALRKTVAQQIETGDTLAAVEVPRAAPAALDAYEVAGMLGRGGMGEVFLAHDPKVGRDIALKRMRREMASTSAIERFLREARIQARLEHPAIVPVHDIGRDAAGVPYFTMKRLAGRTLADAMAGRDRTPRQRLLRAFADVALAIEFAHSRGVIHRDLKPANVMLGEFGEVYVLDWGLGRITGDRDAGTDADIESVPGHTQAGALLGTPGYMAPEQVRGAVVSPAADIYALGAILFEVLAGEPLHPRGTAALQTTLVAVDGRPSQRGVEVAPELDALCK